MIGSILPRALLAAAFAAGLAACGESETDTSGATSPEGALTVPTQEELEAEAARTITPENADDEFEKLKSEIESGS